MSGTENRIGIGTRYEGGRCRFTVWAPFRRTVGLIIGRNRLLGMDRDEWGYWTVEVGDVSAGETYLFSLDGDANRPDPASNWQPDGVFGPSVIVDHNSFVWGDGGWRRPALSDMVMYELHIGTFTPEGTFEQAARFLDRLIELGVNTVEVMPVGQFPGSRGWGYDGVYLFAPQSSYGGPSGLKHLVNECHRKKVAVILDVVYNHFGPEGNYMADFGPYFSNRYNTPWGRAINFDGAYSNEVRNFFFENAMHWVREYHVDGLRLDAVHSIYDMGARHFLQELRERVTNEDGDQDSQPLLIAESDLNDSRIVRSRAEGGFALDAQWSDDFHHSLHALLTGERQGYYVDFGTLADVVEVVKKGYLYQGQYSMYRKRNHGNSSSGLSPEKFVFFAQNHDQIGNRMLGERLSSLVSFEALKLSAGLLFTVPCVPLLFMGEEYGETAPFLYFVDCADPELHAKIREGRKDEFKEFGWAQEPPDPMDLQTFFVSKLDWEKRNSDTGSVLFRYYQALLRLRKRMACLRDLSNERKSVAVWESCVFAMLRWNGTGSILVLANMAEKEVVCTVRTGGRWRRILDSSRERWLGQGTRIPTAVRPDDEIVLAAHQFVLFSGRDKTDRTMSLTH